MYTFDFSTALKALRAGKRVARAGWNGKGMFIYIVPGSEFTVNRFPLNKFVDEGEVVTYRSHIDMKTADDEFVPWIASQSDLLADDWFDLDV